MLKQHTATAVYRTNRYHDRGESNSMKKVPSKTTFQRRGSSFSFTKHVLSAMCQAKVMARKKQMKGEQGKDPQEAPSAACPITADPL